ncbi:MAG: acetyl-CoA hydrolase/transferase C-terminal domain-containing protein [Candidatus Omnitrophota bacterium]
MDWLKMYKEKLISIPEAVGLLKSNQTVCAAMAASEPPGLMNELGKHKDRLENVTVLVCLPLREYDFVLKPEMAGHFYIENWFYGAPDRKVHPQGRSSFIPNNLHQAAVDKVSALEELDFFWGTATPPDKKGYMSLSLGLIIEKEMIKKAKRVILEINENLPRTFGDTHIHVSQVDHFVENTCPLVELPSAPSTEEEKLIGHHIADLIEDRSTIQLGIGGIPNAITAYLMKKKDLGVHTEMFNDGLVDLYQAGVITGKYKTLWPEKMVGGFALGSKKLYDFIDENLAVELQQGKVTNDPRVMAQNYKMVSVNTALQVDITGQVCSESLGSLHFSGTGGQLDTHRGAQWCPNGKAIIALRSSAKGSTISTIVSQLTPGAAVSVPRQDVEYIVTEYGVARLKGLSIRERVKKLISIAHPDFRDKLREEAEKFLIVPKLQIPVSS